MHLRAWERGFEVNELFIMQSPSSRNDKNKVTWGLPLAKYQHYIFLFIFTNNHTAIFSGFAKVVKLFCDLVRVRLIFFSNKSWRISFSSFWAASRFCKEDKQCKLQCFESNLICSASNMLHNSFAETWAICSQLITRKMKTYHVLGSCLVFPALCIRCMW